MNMRHLLHTSPAIAALFVIASVCGSARLAAHHGWTGYTDKETKITGTIEQFNYENPHASVELNADGKRWHVVLAPPSRMQSRGLEKESLKIGDKATVTGYVHRTIATELRAERILIGDKTTELR